MGDTLFWVAIGIMISAVIRWSYAAAVSKRQRSPKDLVTLGSIALLCVILVVAKVMQ